MRIHNRTAALIAALSILIATAAVLLAANLPVVWTAGGLDAGTTGVLKVEIDGEQYADDIRIARVQRVHGSSATWHVGAEFLWTTYPGSRSLRRVASRLQREVAQHAVTIGFESRRPM